MKNTLILTLSAVLFLGLTASYSRAATNSGVGSTGTAASQSSSGSLGGSSSQAGTTSTNTGMNNNSSLGTGASPAGVNSSGSFTSESSTGVGVNTSGSSGRNTTGGVGPNASDSLLNPTGPSSNPNTTDTNLNPTGIGSSTNSNVNGTFLIHRVDSSDAVPLNSSMLSTGEIINVDRVQNSISVKDQSGRIINYPVNDRAVFRSLNKGNRVQIFNGSPRQ